MKASRTDGGPSADPVADDPSAPPPADLDVRVFCGRLTMAGLSEAGAGNLTGYAVGLRPMTAPWTVRQIDVLLFLRELVRRDLIAP